MHKRIDFDRFAAVKMYQVYREGNFVERKEISKCWEGNYFFQSGNTVWQHDQFFFYFSEKRHKIVEFLHF